MLTRNNTFVFTPLLDAMAFYVPVILSAALLIFLHDTDIESSLVLSFIAIWLSDAGHVYGSLLPIIKDPQVRNRFGIRIWLLPIAVVTFWFSLWFYEPYWFYVSFGYFAFFHILMQQYGWVRILLKKQKQTSYRERFDLWVFWTIYLVPVVYWHTPLNNMPRSYVFKNNMPISLPASVWELSHAVLLTSLVVFAGLQIYDYFRTKKVATGKILFFLYSFIWFYGGLVYFSNFVFFSNILLLTHGIAYHIHVNTYRKDSDRFLFPNTKGLFVKVAIYCSLIILISRSWYLFKPFFDIKLGMPIYWIPLMAHHTWDSLLWRKSPFEVAPAVS